MPKLTLHFQPAEGVDPNAAAKELEQKLAALPEVTNAETRADQYRSIGPTEIIAGVTLAVGIIQESAAATEAVSKLLDSVTHLIQSSKNLKNAFVEVGMRKIPIDQRTEKDVETLAKRAVAAG